MEVTEAARKQLHHSLAERDAARNGGKCFRIMPKEDRSLTLNLARPDPSDATFEHDGHVVLAVPKALESFFNNKSVDIDNSGNLTITTSH
jgi:hypothetical protein